MTSKTTKPAAAKSAIQAGADAVQQPLAATREIAGNLGSALTDSGKAYYAGVMALGRTLGEFGRETLNEASEHLRQTMSAKNVREVAEMQAAYAQRRVDMSATHAKEFIDQAHDKSLDVIAPISSLLNKAA